MKSGCVLSFEGMDGHRLLTANETHQLFSVLAASSVYWEPLLRSCKQNFRLASRATREVADALLQHIRLEYGTETFQQQEKLLKQTWNLKRLSLKLLNEDIDFFISRCRMGMLPTTLTILDVDQVQDPVNGR